jgi:hypothetical protein
MVEAKHPRTRFSMSHAERADVAASAVVQLEHLCARARNAHLLHLEVRLEQAIVAAKRALAEQEHGERQGADGHVAPANATDDPVG